MEAIKVVKENGDVNFFGGFDHLVVKQGKWERNEDGRLGYRPIDAPNDCELAFPEKIILRDNDVDKIEEGEHCKVFMLLSGSTFRTVATDTKVFVLGSNGKTIDTFN